MRPPLIVLKCMLRASPMSKLDANPCKPVMTCPATLMASIPFVRPKPRATRGPGDSESNAVVTREGRSGAESDRARRPVGVEMRSKHGDRLRVL